MIHTWYIHEISCRPQMSGIDDNQLKTNKKSQDPWIPQHTSTVY